MSGFNPVKSSQQATALDLKEFEQINALPRQLKRGYTIYNNDQDQAKAFIENHAVFHKSHRMIQHIIIRSYIDNRNTLNPSMLVMHLKTLLRQTQLKFESIVATSIREISFQIVSSVEKKIVKRSFIDAKHLFAVNQKIRQMADEFGGWLSKGNVIPTQAMYHTKCLVNCYNRCRHQQLNVPGEDKKRALVIMNGNS